MAALEVYDAEVPLEHVQPEQEVNVARLNFKNCKPENRTVKKILMRKPGNEKE